MPAPQMPPAQGEYQQGHPGHQQPMPSAGVGAMPPYQTPIANPVKEGGEKALPNISIQAFCDRSETASVIHEMSRDWRMKRTNLKIFMGGLPAATEYYHKESTPSLIIIESGMRGEELFAQLGQLASVCDEGTQLVMIGASNDIKLYRQLIEQGVSDYIVPPFHPLSLIRSISELFSDPEKPFTGRVAAFFGAKGGVGSSTLAHNIAWCMSEQIQQETALIDLDASWGTTGLDFAYDATEGLEEALSEPERLDETLLDRIMLRHTPKLSILPASCSLSQNPTMSSEAYEAVVNGVRSISPMTILDMPHFWCDWTTNVLTSADDVVITATPDLANLRNAKNLVDFLKAERPNDAEPLLILNKTGTSKSNEISVKDFSAAVGIEPALVIGFDPEAFIEAANDGKMLTDIKSQGQTVSGLNYLARRLKTGTFPMSDAGRGKGLSRLNKIGSGSGKTSSFLSKLKGK
jgi:pilus assembly protein CpaE